MTKKILFISLPVVFSLCCLIISLKTYFTYREEHISAYVASHNLVQRTKIEEKDLQEIVKLMLGSVAERLEDQDIYISFDEKSEKHLAKEGFDITYGARPLRRMITKVVEDKLSEEMLMGNIKRGDKITVTEEEGKLRFNHN